MAETDIISEAIEATATALFQTTSATLILITGMAITPPAGTYLALFSATGFSSSGSSVPEYQIFSNGVAVAHSLRSWGGGGNQFANTPFPLHTQAKITVNGSQVVDVRGNDGGGGTLNINGRSLYLIRLDS